MTATINRTAGALDRFKLPLYTIAEAARYLDVPPSTLSTWAHGYLRRPSGRPEVRGEPILTALPKDHVLDPSIPFIGLAEGMVLTAIRRHGVSLQRIRPALVELERQFGWGHVLASTRLYTDGVEVLYDYAQHGDDPDAAHAARELVVIRNGQRALNGVIETYLRRLTFGDDGYVKLIRLPAYEVADIVADPSRGFGQPIFTRGGARLEDALSMFRAGEPLEIVAQEYNVPADQLEDAVRVATRMAA